jgi:phosphate transport system protein
MNEENKRITKGNRTLKDIIDLILYENPSTQDEIAERLGITRRYVTKLIQPLVKKGVIQRAYTIDFRKLEENPGVIDIALSSPRETSGYFIIKKWLKNMTDHVRDQLELSYDAIVENDSDKAKKVLDMDYATDNFLEKLRTSVQMIMNVEPNYNFNKAAIVNEIAFDLERIGDHSARIAKFALNDYNLDEFIILYLNEMYEIAQSMIVLATDAFINEKNNLSEIRKKVKEMNRLQKDSFTLMNKQMSEIVTKEGSKTDYFIYLTHVVRSFERIGDISTEIIYASEEFYTNSPRLKP